MLQNNQIEAERSLFSSHDQEQTNIPSIQPNQNGLIQNHPQIPYAENYWNNQVPPPSYIAMDPMNYYLHPQMVAYSHPVAQPGQLEQPVNQPSSTVPKQPDTNKKSPKKLPPAPKGRNINEPIVSPMSSNQLQLAPVPMAFPYAPPLPGGPPLPLQPGVPVIPQHPVAAPNLQPLPPNIANVFQGPMPVGVPPQYGPPMQYPYGPQPQYYPPYYYPPRPYGHHGPAHFPYIPQNHQHREREDFEPHHRSEPNKKNHKNQHKNNDGHRKKNKWDH